jgi:hypothetical protein
MTTSEVARVMGGDGEILTVAGRSCGECTLCCKLLLVEELAKPRDLWCTHCKPGRGCLIYHSRPTDCKTFHCGYLMRAELGEEWKPNKCKIVLTSVEGINKIVAFVDPQRTDSWKREPYYSSLKKLAVNAALRKGWVVVRVERHTYVIFPDRDVDIGDLGEDETIVTSVSPTPSGLRFQAHKIRRDNTHAFDPEGKQQLDATK